MLGCGRNYRTFWPGSNTMPIAAFVSIASLVFHTADMLALLQLVQHAEGFVRYVVFHGIFAQEYIKDGEGEC